MLDNPRNLGQIAISRKGVISGVDPKSLEWYTLGTINPSIFKVIEGSGELNCSLGFLDITKTPLLQYQYVYIPKEITQINLDLTGIDLIGSFNTNFYIDSTRTTPLLLTFVNEPDVGMRSDLDPLEDREEPTRILEIERGVLVNLWYDSQVGVKYIRVSQYFPLYTREDKFRESFSSTTTYSTPITTTGKNLIVPTSTIDNRIVFPFPTVTITGGNYKLNNNRATSLITQIKLTGEILTEDAVDSGVNVTISLISGLDGIGNPHIFTSQSISIPLGVIKNPESRVILEYDISTLDTSFYDEGYNYLLEFSGGTLSITSSEVFSGIRKP